MHVVYKRKWKHCKYNTWDKSCANSYLCRTRSAMEGAFTFETSLRKRLSIINPTLSQVQELANKESFLLSNGFIDLCERLQRQNKQIFIISGGFKDLIVPLSKRLRIPAENVFANELIFDQLGNYQNFADLPTARTGGKLDVIKEIKKRCKQAGSVVHIGDGITDLETREEVDLFIGFGGNVVRDIVKQQSEWFVTDFEELNSLLEEDE